MELSDVGTRLLVVALVLPACGPKQVSHVKPRITTSIVARQVFGLGEPIPLSTSWGASCEETNKSGEVTGVFDCKDRAYRVDLSCDGPCMQDPRLAAGAVGPFAFTVRLVAANGDQSPVYQSPTLDIRPPDALEVYCYYPEFDALTDEAEPPRALTRCDSRPLTVASPWVQIRARLGDRTYRTYAATLAGRSRLEWTTRQTGADIELVTSLVDVVTPGRHEVTASLGGVSTTVTIEVAP